MNTQQQFYNIVQDVPASSKNCQTLATYLARRNLAVSTTWIRDYFLRTEPFPSMGDIVKMLSGLGLEVGLYEGEFDDFMRCVSPRLALLDEGHLLHVARVGPTALMVVRDAELLLQGEIVPREWFETRWQNVWITDTDPQT